MKVPAVRDRRVERTHRLLRDALVSLVIEKGWDEISILDICERADVGRSTFYTHFADREDLLLSGFDDLKKALRAAARLGDPQRELRFMRPLLLHAADNRKMFRALGGKKTALAVQARFRLLVHDLTTEELSARLSGVALAMTAAWITGGCVELFARWIDARTAADVDDVDAAIEGFVKKALRPG